MSARALEAYAVGLIGFVFVKVLAPGFFARQNTATPVRVGALSMVVNVVLSLALFSWLAHVGLALATSIAALVNAGLLARLLLRDGTLVLEPGMSILVMRVLGATGIMVAVLWWTAGDNRVWLDGDALYRIGRIILCVVSGFAAYLLALFVLGVRPRHLALHDE